MGKDSKKNKVKIKITRQTLRKAAGIFIYLKPYRWTFLLGWCFLVLSTLSTFAFPYLMGQMLGGTSAGSMNAWTDWSMQLSDINALAFTLLILFIAQAVFSYFRVILFTNVTENALCDLRNDAFQQLVYFPMDFFNKNKVGELTSRISNDITQIQETMRTTIAEFFRQFLTVVGGTCLLFYFSWKLALIMLLTVPLMAIIAVLFGRFIKKLAKKAQDQAAQGNAILEETLTSIANVKAFTNELFLLSRFKQSTQKIRELNIKSGRWRGAFISFIIFCLFGAIVFIIWRGMLMTQGESPELATGDFFAFVMYTIMLGSSVGSLPELYSNIQKAIGATENLIELIDTKTETQTHIGTQTPVIEGDIHFQNISFAYPQRKEVQVLKNISFSAKKNETIALVGKSGVGKSTIATLILNFYPIKTGRLLFGTYDAKSIDLLHLRKHIAIVPQEVMLFAGTIAENIAFGNPNASEEDIFNAAKSANAIEFIDRFPEKLNTQVGDRGIQLSGGQKQRIAIARAILKNPTILILDEATSALDTESEKLVQEALEKLMNGRTCIVIAHRLSTIRKADKIIVLKDGQIVETGEHAELMLKNNVYAQLVKG